MARMASIPKSKQTLLTHDLDRLSRSKWDEVLQLRLKDSLIELDVVAMNSMTRTVGRKSWWMASMMVEQLQIPMNVVTYNSLISSAEDWPWSLALLEQMQQNRWSPNVISLNAALKVMDDWIKALHLTHAVYALQPDLVTCSTLGSRLGPWYSAASAVAQMMMRGFRMNTLTYNAFANSIQTGDWKSANLLLSQAAIQRDVVSYSIMMDGRQEITEWPFAFHFLRRTQQLAILPDPALFHIALKNLEDSKRWTSSLSILSAQKSLGQMGTGVSYALALGAFGSFGPSLRWATALRLMEAAEATGQKPQQGSFTALLDCVESWQTSLQLCRRMEMVSVLQSAQSTNKIMSTLREEWSLVSDLLQSLFMRRLSPISPRAGQVTPGPWRRALAFGKDRWLTSFSWSLAMCLLNQAVSFETAMHNAVVSSCEKSTRWTWAMDLLQRITIVGRPSTASFNAAASAAFGHWGIVLDIFQRLSQRHLQATAFSFTTALSSCEKCHAWQRALGILGAVDQPGQPATVAVFNAAISSCERGRQWQKALALLFDMDLLSIEKDVISVNSAISCCEKCSRWCESLALLHDMRFQEILPDMFSINSALLSCRNAHRWRESVDLFNRVKEFSLQADALSWDFVLAACEECGQWMQANALLLKFRELSNLQFLRPFDTGAHVRRSGPVAQWISGPATIFGHST